MRKTMQSLRDELGVVSQGRSGATETSILFHLAFRLTEDEAKKFILKAAELGTSESIYARKAILDRLTKEDK
jgi:hypothetical protein